MQKVADAFLAGDHDWLAGVYVYPMAVYIDGEIEIEATAEATLNNLFTRRAAVLSVGTKRIEAEVINYVDSTDGRFPVRVDWNIFDAEDKRITTNEIRYYCRHVPDGTIKIEILEFITRGMASLVDVADRKVPKH